MKKFTVEFTETFFNSKKNLQCGRCFFNTYTHRKKDGATTMPPKWVDGTENVENRMPKKDWRLMAWEKLISRQIREVDGATSFGK